MKNMLISTKLASRQHRANSSALSSLQPALNLPMLLPSPPSRRTTFMRNRQCHPLHARWQTRVSVPSPSTSSESLRQLVRDPQQPLIQQHKHRRCMHAWVWCMCTRAHSRFNTCRIEVFKVQTTTPMVEPEQEAARQLFERCCGGVSGVCAGRGPASGKITGVGSA
jgi:hypothetical protein